LSYFWHLGQLSRICALCCREQAGTVGGGRPIISAANTRMSAAIATNAVQAPGGNVVIRPAQSTVVVGPTSANTTQPPVQVVGGRFIAASTTAASVPRPVVPANASVAGMLLQKNRHVLKRLCKPYYFYVSATISLC